MILRDKKRKTNVKISPTPVESGTKWQNDGNFGQDKLDLLLIYFLWDVNQRPWCAEQLPVRRDRCSVWKVPGVPATEEFIQHMRT